MKLAPEDKKQLLSQQEEIRIKESLEGNEGWRFLANKLREELQSAILEKVADDPKIITLLSVLKTADSREEKAILEDAIKNLTN